MSSTVQSCLTARHYIERDCSACQRFTDVLFSKETASRGRRRRKSCGFKARRCARLFRTSCSTRPYRAVVRCAALARGRRLALPDRRARARRPPAGDCARLALAADSRLPGTPACQRRRSRRAADRHRRAQDPHAPRAAWPPRSGADARHPRRLDRGAVVRTKPPARVRGDRGALCGGGKLRAGVHARRLLELPAAATRLHAAVRLFRRAFRGSEERTPSPRRLRPSYPRQIAIGRLARQLADRTLTSPPSAVSRRINAERLVILGWVRAILLQLAHPLIAAGVAEHSTFRAGTPAALGRLHQTIGAMLALTFGDEPARETALEAIRSIHRRVHGALRTACGPFPAGTPYSAEDPALLLWVHATLIDSIVRVYDRLVMPLTDADRDAYCADAVDVAVAL